MKKTAIYIFVFIHGLLLNAQIAPTKYFVGFADKQGTPFALSNPTDFLSQRAIDRRTNQGLTYDSTDLPVSPIYVDSVINSGIVNLLNSSKWLNGIVIQTNDLAALGAIANMGFVTNIRPLARKRNTPSEVNKFDLTEGYGMKSALNMPAPRIAKGINSFDYGLSYNQIEMIGVDFLHNQGYAGSGIIIAVLDAGFFRVDSLFVFDSLRTNGQILGTRDFVDATQNVYEAHTHGMMVLSLMGGNMPGQLIGTSPMANFWLLRTEDVASEYVIEEYNWVCAAEFADSAGADIINSSLGYYEFDDPQQNYVYANMDGLTTVVSRGANSAAEKGILVVNSAGNSALTPWQRIIAPSDAQGALSVGSVNYDQYYSAFSSVGPSADGRVKPDVAAQGEGTIVANTQNSIMSGNGTSFSSPIIAGAAACLWEANPQATNWQIMQAIRESAHQYNAPDSLLGYGIPNFTVAHMLLAGVSIDNDPANHSFLTFPNPFDGAINIIYYAVDTHSISLNLYDINGRLLISNDNILVHLGYNNIYLSNLEQLSKGIYFLKLNTGKISETRKLVKTY